MLLQFACSHGNIFYSAAKAVTSRHFHVQNSELHKTNKITFMCFIPCAAPCFQHPEVVDEELERRWSADSSILLAVE